MAANTSASATGGSRKSTAAKSPAPAAAKGSRPRGSRARGAAKSPAGSTSDTTTSTEPPTPVPSTPVATAEPLPTESSDASEPKPDVLESVAPPGDGEDGAERFEFTYIVSVFKVGKFVERALVEMPAELAFQIAKPDRGNPLIAVVAEGVYRDLAAAAAVAPALAQSALAGTAIRLAMEMENPYNSATSKSMCARALIETMEQIRALMPDGEEEGDELDELEKRRQAREAAARVAAK